MLLEVELKMRCYNVLFKRQKVWRDQRGDDVTAGKAGEDAG
jgi:hypothetical protein